MKRKIAIIGSVLLAIVALTAWAAPVFAANLPGAAQSVVSGEQAARSRVMARLLLVQDAAKVDSFIAAAVDSGRISQQQGAQIKDFWTNHHQQVTRRLVLGRLMQAKDGARVQAFLDKGVSAGKMTSDQAGKIMAAWQKIHSK